MNKKEKFKNAVEIFKNSEQTSEDYLNLIIVSISVLRFGDGLLWSDIEEILNEVINK